jgi:ferredoxin
VDQRRAEEPEDLEFVSGFEAVARTQRLLCPGAVSGDAATAEGLALSGVRAASLGEGVGEGPRPRVSWRGASCVHHVVGEPGSPDPATIELVAASAQEAVDHALAAHWLSLRLGRPVRCTLPPGVAGALAPVHLPRRSWAVALIEDDASSADPDAGSARIFELVEQAFERVGGSTGRPLRSLQYHGSPEPDTVLLGTGDATPRVREALAALSSAETTAGALELALASPFPAAALRKSLGGATRLVCATGEALHARVSELLGSEVEVSRLSVSDGTSLLERLCSELGLSPSAAAAAREPSRRLALAPAGPWGDALAAEIGGMLVRVGRCRLGSQSQVADGTTVLSWQSDAIGEATGDLLVAAHPSLLQPGGCLDQVRAGSTLLVVSPAADEDELARSLSPDARAAILDRELRLHWVALPEPTWGASAQSLAGAALAALLHGESAGDGDAVDRLATGLEAAGRSDAARHLREGVDSLRAASAQCLDPERCADELDFRPPDPLPRLPEPPAEVDASWAARIRAFHLGRGEPAPALPALPAALRALGDAMPSGTAHPFVLVASEAAATAQPLREVLASAVAALRGSGRSARALGDNIQRLVRIAARRLSERSGANDLPGLLASAGEAMVVELALPDPEEVELRDDLDRLRDHLPHTLGVYDLQPGIPSRLYLAVLRAARAPLRRAFRDELARLTEGLRDLIELDRMASSGGAATESLSASLGAAASEHLDTAALAKALPAARVSGALEEGRRARIEAAREVIESFLASDQPEPEAIFVEPPGSELAPPEAVVQHHPDPLVAAVGIFDGTCRRMARLFRAVRTAQLELRGQYRAELHDAPLAGLDWEGFTARELALTPAVAALTTGRRLRRRDQGSLSDLLRSSRPVHVIACDEVGASDEAEDLSRFHVDLGYLVVAHRETFALGTTLARPERVVEGLARMVQAPRPGVFLARLPASEPAALQPLLAEAALAGRVCPDFRYDPDAGDSWADRFDLDGNPEPERPWTRPSLRHRTGDAEAALDLVLTFADAVALEPAYVRHFRVIPTAAWSDEQVSLAEYLESFEPGSPARRIPFIWVLGESQTLQRAVVTRELALASLDRLRSWRVLQELAGYANVFAERAAADARRDALAEAETRVAALEALHGEELERARREAARESMERLAAVLLSEDGLAAAVALPSRAAAPETVTESQSAEAAAVPSPAEEAEPELVEEAASFDDPYIDTLLCTSCNECTQLNSLLFRYNADKQAYIADASAGTFAELVRAAELCPARCIHPGNPRAGDDTATPELVARAAVFN